MKQNIKAKISISRSNGGDGTSVRISVKCATSRVKFLEIEMTPEDLGNAITGLSDIEVDAEVSNLHRIGKKREFREEVVEAELPGCDTDGWASIIIEAAKHLEVDGWMASAYPAIGTQGGRVLIQGTKDTYRCKVSLVRWVDIQEAA